MTNLTKIQFTLALYHKGNIAKVVQFKISILFIKFDFYYSL